MTVDFSYKHNQKHDLDDLVFVQERPIDPLLPERTAIEASFRTFP
jgi:hypothetical protein